MLFILFGIIVILSLMGFEPKTDNVIMAQWEFLIPGGLSLLSSFIGGTKSPPRFGVSASDINQLIEKYRQSGMEGIKQLGINERENATSRLAASGMEPTQGMQQALYNPILQKLSGATTQLEGQLAGVEGNMLMGQAQGQQRADLTGYENFANLFSGMGDLSGLFALQGYMNQGGQTGGQQAYQKPFDLWNQQYLQQKPFNT